MSLSLTEGKVAGVLVRFSLPFLLSSLIQTIYSSVNMIILGWFASPASLAGAGNGGMLIMSLMNIFWGFSTGGMILLGQYYGARQEDNTAKAFGNAILINTVTALAGIVLVFTCGQLFLRITNVPVELDEKGLHAYGEAWRYMRIFSIGLIFNAGYNLISASLRALGDSRTPLVIIAISCAANVVLDLLFVGALHMGASGAALATILAQAAGFALSLLYLWRHKLPFRFSREDLRPDGRMIRTIGRLGLPISLQVALNTLSFILIAAIINKMGLYASSANGIVNNIVNVCMIIPFAFGSALSAISAQNLGAGKIGRALESTRYGILFSLVVAVPATILANLYPAAIVSVISPNPDVIEAAARFLIPFSWDFLLVSFLFCINGFLNGCGITTFVAVHETVAALLVRAPLSWALSLLPGATLFHVGIGTPAASVASLVMCFIYYRLRLSGGRLAQLRIAETKR